MDWRCDYCDWTNRARHETCYRCSSPRPFPAQYVRYKNQVIKVAVSSGGIFPREAVMEKFNLENLCLEDGTVIGPQTRIIDLQQRCAFNSETQPLKVAGTTRDTPQLLPTVRTCTRETSKNESRRKRSMSTCETSKNESRRRQDSPRDQSINIQNLGGSTEVYFAGRGEEVFAVPLDAGRLPVHKLTKDLGILREGLEIWVSNWEEQEKTAPLDTRLSISEIRARFGSTLGCRDSPFLISGFHDLQGGFQAYFRTIDCRNVRVEVVRVIFRSATTGVYSVKVCDHGKEEAAVLKLSYDDRLDSGSEWPALRDLNSLRTARKCACPSTPTVVECGAFLSSGERSPVFGDAIGELIKPVGVCVKGQAFETACLLKAAFDLLLALYHLFLVNRRHRNVTLENVIYVQLQNQFVLVDFKDASMCENEREGEVHDCVGLMLTLARMRGWQGERDCRSAVAFLFKVHTKLGEFGRYARMLDNCTQVPEFKRWLTCFASEINVLDVLEKELVEGGLEV